MSRRFTWMQRQEVAEEAAAVLFRSLDDDDDFVDLLGLLATTVAVTLRKADKHGIEDAEKKGLTIVNALAKADLEVLGDLS